MDEVVLVARCDLCGEGDRAAAVSRVVVGIATYPAATTALSRPDLMVVDLCDSHAVAAAAAEALAAAGRAMSRRHTAPVPTASGARLGRPATSGGNVTRHSMPTACPVRGCGAVIRRNNIVKHLTTVHGWKVPRQPKRCPDCGLTRPAGSRQSMQAHRAAVHGYDHLAAVIEANR